MVRFCIQFLCLFSCSGVIISATYRLCFCAVNNTLFYIECSLMHLSLRRRTKPSAAVGGRSCVSIPQFLLTLEFLFFVDDVEMVSVFDLPMPLITVHFQAQIRIFT